MCGGKSLGAKLQRTKFPRRTHIGLRPHGIGRRGGQEEGRKLQSTNKKLTTVICSLLKSAGFGCVVEVFKAWGSFRVEAYRRLRCWIHRICPWVGEADQSGFMVKGTLKGTSLRNRIGKYELGRTLGEGNFAKVKYALNVETGQSYAVKILDKEKVFQYNIVNHIKREICTLKLIKHSNVVRLYEVLASKKKIYIVLEYVTGGELFDKIACSGRLKETEARKYFQQLVDAVGHCHSRGVYHRDLKPENVLLDANGNVKVSDFGLSALPQQFRADGLLHTTCGSPNYVAPEVLADRGYDGATADLWSCGVILFVLLAGWLPFDDRNLAVLYQKIFKSDFKCPNWVSDSARNIIKRILDPNPKTRITIPEILEDEWFKQGYSPANYVEEDISLDDVDAAFTNSEENLLTAETGPILMNAFQLIAMSRSLDLSGFFEEEDAAERKMRFTSMYPAKDIIEKIEETVRAMGFVVQKKNGKLKLLQDLKSNKIGRLSVATEVFEVTPSLHMVELRKSSGDIGQYREVGVECVPSKISRERRELCTLELAIKCELVGASSHAPRHLPLPNPPLPKQIACGPHWPGWPADGMRPFSLQPGHFAILPNLSMHTKMQREHEKMERTQGIQSFRWTMAAILYSMVSFNEENSGGICLG
eukprot:Gb_10748 [translate_table: standard]